MSQATRSARRGSRMVAVGVIVVLVSSLAVIAPASADTASEIGVWGAPWEEGGSGVPMCSPLEDGTLICKPTAVSIAQLATGHLLYWNGIEASENPVYSIAPEAGNWTRDSQARIMSLLGSTPAWANPFPMRGPAGNDAPCYETLPPDEALLGMVGVPGRPGDGFAGSIFGQLYEAPPVAPPDDPAENDADMFCSDLVQLADGRILIAGGTDFYAQPNVPYDVPVIGGWGVPELEGLRNSRIYDPKTGTFTKTAPMKYGRWYPTLVTLPNGDAWVASGVTKLVKNTQASQVRRTETFSLKTMKWTENYTSMASENSLPLYARVHLMPNGKIFYNGVGQMNGFGPTGWAVDEALWALAQFYNIETKQWEMVGPTAFGIRGGAFSTLLPLKPPYDKGTLLIGGGTLLPTPAIPLALPIVERVTVDKAGNVTNERAANLNNARWFTSTVLLPDGKVAAFSGANLDEVLLPGLMSAVREAEMYDPATDTWTPIGSGARDRTYHNSAILLPDGRVLVGGHSPIPAFNHKHMDLPAPLANNHKDPSFEIYSPPYLFRGERPQIAYSPAGVAYDKSFTVNMGSAEAIESVSLIRLPAQTHTMASDMRSVELAFTQIGDTLTVKAPPDGVTAPPGPYYLFVNKKSAKGPIPSVAAITMVGNTVNAAKAFQPMGAAKTSSVKGTKSTKPAVKPGRNLPATELTDAVANVPAASMPKATAPSKRVEAVDPRNDGTVIPDQTRNVAWVTVAALVWLTVGAAVGRQLRRRRVRAPA
ncbi:MAG TPA: galactose oxidase-like domain-containing protein [Actinomycetota bacterium]|nr:galactose oxidase-like domain-containing protein [Actinomycetota bacterium]